MALSYGVFGPLELPLGFGLLRLGTEGRPDEPAALALIHQALDGGIRVLDTADSYSLGDKDLHYAEALARKAVATWSGPRHEVRIVTKVGMARPKGRWVPNGRPAHLRQAVEGSLAALGVERLFLLLLHANDPGTPFEESLATLAALQREGKVEHLGLCNADVAEVRQAQRHFQVAALQNELSVQDRKSATSGTLALARELGIPFLAHRPLGGHAKVSALEKNRAMKPLADRHGVTRHEAALATLLDLGHPVIPLVGATRGTSLASSLRAARLRLDEADRAAVASRLSFEPTLEAREDLAPDVDPSTLPLIEPGAAPGAGPEVVVVMGIQGAGKSTLVQRYVEAGYERLNRDLLGGKLGDLAALLSERLAAGARRVVLDNTYATRASRRAVIRAAHRHGVPVRCLWLSTPVGEALINVVNRVLDRHGVLPGPEELAALAKTDPNLPPPAALSRYAACFEPPGRDEGFSVVEELPFVRAPGPVGTGRALLLDVDGTLRTTKSGDPYPKDPADVVLLPGRREVLARYVEEGVRLFLVSNQSGIASGSLSRAQAEACLTRTVELLGLPVTEAAMCPHPAFPVGCFCRKPMPGLGVWLSRRHGLSMDEVTVVGDQDSDEAFAKGLGAAFVHADRFFAAGG